MSRGISIFDRSSFSSYNSSGDGGPGTEHDSTAKLVADIWKQMTTLKTFVAPVLEITGKLQASPSSIASSPLDKNHAKLPFDDGHPLGTDTQYWECLQIIYTFVREFESLMPKYTTLR
jgi:hypothetical protein